MMKFGKAVVLAAALAASAGMSAGAAMAATINGQIDIVGSINLPSSDFSPAGNANLSSTGTVLIAIGDFFGLEGLIASLTDIEFEAPGSIWSVGGFTFTANSFFDFEDTGTKAFSALGTVTGNGFEPTDGILTFSAQSGAPTVSFSSTTIAPIPVPAAGLLLVGALGALGAMRRRKTS